jgi:D-sedoheptulose 7-phosphate isomerase
MPGAKRFIILDRDGTIIVERSYLSDPAGVELLPCAAEGLRRMESLDWGRLVVTNQSGIGRGYFDRKSVDEIHARMIELLRQAGTGIDAIYVCPHAPEDGCGCRKPGTALVLRAAAEWGFDPARSVVIGDKAGDVQLARALGARSILVRTGYGEEQLKQGLAQPDFVAENLLSAAEIIANMHDSNNGEALWPGAAEYMRGHLREGIATRERLLQDCGGAILEAAEAICHSLRGGGKVLFCGNGGSAADSQHIAAELVNVLSQEFPRPGLPAIALTTDTSILTACANDFGFAGIFERQVQALGRPGDAVVGISTSGNSENVVRALQYARKHGMKTLALTGASGGKLAGIADISIRVPSTSAQHIQESHIAVGHILCGIVERSLA